MTDSDVLGRIEALEAQVAELKSVQDLLMRLLATTRPLANLLEFYGATDAAEQALYNLLDELWPLPGGPSPANRPSATSRCAWPRSSRRCAADRAFVQTLIDTLKVDRPAYRELHAYMAGHGWPSWDSRLQRVGRGQVQRKFSIRNRSTPIPLHRTYRMSDPIGRTADSGLARLPPAWQRRGSLR